MSIPEFEYLGHTVRYNDNSDTWSCHSLRIEHSSIAMVKQKILEVDKSARDLDGVPVIQVHSYGSLIGRGLYTPLVATTIDADDEQNVWVMHTVDNGRGRKVGARSKVSVRDLVADTPENRAELEAVDAERKRLQAEQKALEARLGNVPRMSFAGLKAANLKPLTDDQAEKFTAKIRKRPR